MASEHIAKHDDTKSHMGTFDRERLAFEKIKLQADSTRHITTLAIGIIVLVTTFMDKLPKPLSRTDLLKDSVVYLLICVLFAFIHLYATTLLHFNRPPSGTALFRVSRQTHEEVRYYMVHFIYFFFCIGLIDLARFALWNIPNVK